MTLTPDNLCPIGPIDVGGRDVAAVVQEGLRDRKRVGRGARGWVTFTGE